MKLIYRFNTTIHHEQVRALYQQSPFLFVGILFTMAVVAIFFWGKVEQEVLLIWVGLNISLTIARVILVKSFHRIKPEGETLVKWGLVFAASATLSGLIWGSIALIFLQPSQLESVLLVAIVLTGMTAGSLVPLSTFIPAYYGFCLPALIPFSIVLLSQVTGVLVFIGYLVLAFILVNLGYSIVVNRNLAESIRLRFENLELLDNLKLQKDIAVKANTDKSRFLAATSHDLRQPLHAMDLYLGALENLLTNEEQKELFKKSRQSSIALMDLLSALMDISRLDTGDVIVNRSIVDVSVILQNLYDEFEEQAEQLAVELKIRARSIYVDTDPLLLSRMLRNLLSNALRHSQAKKILITSKVIANKVYLGVRDNGCGIPDSETGKIFSEFYQLNNPERDRNKGLGLGLAITKRLSGLLGHKIVLHTKQNRGCCFRLELSRIETDGEVNAEINIVQDADISGLFIMLIEDEIHVRDAMCALLKQWGCELLVADSLDNLEKELNSLSYPEPDIIIVDYRLRENKNGLQAVVELRERYQSKLPAIVISGDTDKQLARRVKSEDCVMLNKPVLPEVLRDTLYQLSVSTDT